MKREPTCPNCGGHVAEKREAEFRGFLAVLVVVLTFGIAYVRLILGRETETLVPTWAGVLVGSVVSNYFVSRSGEVMRRITREHSEPEK